VQDPAVASIRIAETLNQRYGVLIRKGDAIDSDELELRTGEATQIYPEIWRHLDDARTALAGRGANVGAYDEIRKTERGVGVTNVHIDGPSTAIGAMLNDYQAKTVVFNGQGHRNAQHAARELKSLLPDVDWAALERAEAAELASFDLGPPAWKKAVFYAIAGVVGLIAAAGLVFYYIG
jgi:hypothetical protein